jgi:hypothetical protein
MSNFHTPLNDTKQTSSDELRQEPIKIFIGYDHRESIAWHTLTHSILRQSSVPVAIIPLALSSLSGLMSRPRDPKQSNDFSFSRFLVPYLSGYQGFALFLDCDMMLRTDIAELFDVARQNPDKALHVVKHDYVPCNNIKYLGNVQHAYPRKNWSSVVLWNCAHEANRVVTPEFVNTSTGMALHRFSWLEDDLIGELDKRWNWLVGEYSSPPEDVKNVHWTIGGPYFNEYREVDFASEWCAEYERMTFCAQLESKTK